jgi:hypothetical protein
MNRRDYLHLMPFPEDLSDFYTIQSKIIKEYFETRLQLIKLQAVLAVSRLLTLIFVLIIVFILLLFILLFLGLALAWWLTELFDSKVLGFSGAAAVFLLLLVMVIVLRKVLLQNPLIRLFIRTTSKELSND